MEYELTTYGREYRETASARIDKMWETLPIEEKTEGMTRRKRTPAFDRLNKRVFILDSIHRGRHPIDDAFDYLKEGYRKERGKGALRKELDRMLRDNLVREVSGDTEIVLERG